MADFDEAQRRPAPVGLGSELATRVASALVLAFAALLATYLGGAAFALLWLAAGVAIAAEWSQMTRVEPRRRLQGVIVIALTILALGRLGGVAALPLALAAGLGVLAVAGLAANGYSRLWAPAGLAYAAVIALVPPMVRDDPRLGVVGILWMFAVVWATDIAAYFTGRALGGPKLMPRLSPKKTWSGFAGGLLAGTAAGIAVTAAAAQLGWTPPIGWPAIVALSALASVLSQAGDLAESGLKRRCRVKDSGWLIPGHGGVMDRLDGFWAAAALVGLCLAAARS